MPIDGGGPVTGLRGVSVVYPGGSCALDGVTLEARQGEILAIVGPSGSGKSTLLRVVAGLVPVRSGEVVIAGRTVTQLAADERRVAMVFETATAMPFLTVAENMGWGLNVRRVPTADAERRVGEQARGLGLARLLRRMPRTLSHGESSRVGIGRALVHSPSAFLFDEPLSHLDAGQRRAVRRRIVDVVRGHDVATLYVTHDQEEAMGLADRIAVLDAGRVVQVGTPRELYARPASAFVASFIGLPAINLLPARPVVAGDAGGFRVGARTLPLWGPLPAALARWTQQRGGDESLILGIRPEHVHDARAGSDPSAVTMPAVVLAVHETGPDAVLTLEVAAPAVTVPGSHPPEAGPGSTPFGVSSSSRQPSSATPAEPARIRARFARNTTLRPGDTVPIAVDVTQAHTFDPVSGTAISHPDGPPEA